MIQASTVNAKRESDGAKRLMADMVAQALRDISSNNPKIKRHAEQFIEDPIFATLCTDLDLCVKEVRKRVHRGHFKSFRY